MTTFAALINRLGMDIEQYILGRCNDVLGTDGTSIVKRLEGGMSNFTFVVENGGSKYTYRVPGKYAERFVDRDIERNNISKAEQIGLNNKTVFFDTATGEKMAEYIEGTILSDTDVSEHDTEAAAALKRLHQSGISMNDYDPFGRLLTYENYCKEYKFVHDGEYNALRQQMDRLQSKYDNTAKVACHCDFQPSNLVATPTRLYVLDWEYAGMNDPFYDIACYGNAGLDKALSLLAAYVGHSPTDDELRRLYFWRSFQCLQWYNVAIFKDLIGLGKELHLDFAGIAKTFIRMAEQLLDMANDSHGLTGFDSFNIYGHGTRNG